MVSQQLLSELRTILQEEYGAMLSQEVVADIGNTLVSFFELLGKIEAGGIDGDKNFRSPNS